MENPVSQKRNVIGISVLVVLFALWGLIAVQDTSEKAPAETSSKETLKKQTLYQNERNTALSVVMVQRTQKGVKLADFFKTQKEQGVIVPEGRWVAVKDGERYVVIYRGNFSDGSLNNPQWGVMLPSNPEDLLEAKISAINGTAKSYTPELDTAGGQNELLSDERLLQLISEQGDLYVGE